jgi:hypothetical protein
MADIMVDSFAVRSTLGPTRHPRCVTGAGHHSALAYGHLSQPLEAFAGMLAVEFERVR